MADWTLSNTAFPYHLLTSNFTVTLNLPLECIFRMSTLYGNGNSTAQGRLFVRNVQPERIEHQICSQGHRSDQMCRCGFLVRWMQTGQRRLL